MKMPRISGKTLQNWRSSLRGYLKGKKTAWLMGFRPLDERRQERRKSQKGVPVGNTLYLASKQYQGLRAPRPERKTDLNPVKDPLGRPAVSLKSGVIGVKQRRRKPVIVHDTGFYVDPKGKIVSPDRRAPGKEEKGKVIM